MSQMPRLSVLQVLHKLVIGSDSDFDPDKFTSSQNTRENTWDYNGETVDNNSVSDESEAVGEEISDLKEWPSWLQLSSQDILAWGGTADWN